MGGVVVTVGLSINLDPSNAKLRLSLCAPLFNETLFSALDLSLSGTNMCGGAIISDFVDIRPGQAGRKLSPEELWSELDTVSDLLGFDSYPNQFSYKVPQKPKQLNKGR